MTSRHIEKEGSCSIDFEAKLHFYSEKEVLRKLVQNTHFRGAREKITDHSNDFWIMHCLEFEGEGLTWPFCQGCTKSSIKKVML